MNLKSDWMSATKGNWYTLLLNETLLPCPCKAKWLCVCKEHPSTPIYLPILLLYYFGTQIRSVADPVDQWHHTLSHMGLAMVSRSGKCYRGQVTCYPIPRSFRYEGTNLYCLFNYNSVGWLVGFPNQWLTEYSSWGLFKPLVSNILLL